MSTRDPLSAPTLEVALAASTSAWQTDLERLCRTAKDLFADVVWELQPDPEREPERETSNVTERRVEEVWGHKAIVYARSPPSFQSRYFSFRPAPSGTPTPNGEYSPGETPELEASVLSLVSPSSSPTPDLNGSLSLPFVQGLQRLSIPHNPLFASEIEHLYTAKGLPQAAFDFLFAPISSSSGTEAEDLSHDPTDKLRKDLVYMWRARLYSDVKISLIGDDAHAKTHDGASAVFAAHKFLLAARSHYFYTQLVSWTSKPIPKLVTSTQDSSTETIQTISLPAPPFTPATLHFALGYLYSGTLSFSHRTYDLATALALLKGAVYLQVIELADEVRMRVVEEMMHGLAFARLSEDEYQSMLDDHRKLNPDSHTWAVNIPGNMCICKTCSRRVPRLLAFASAPDVTDPVILRGATRVLTNVLGAGWVNNEFATMGATLHVSLLNSVKKRVSTYNLLGLMIAIKEGLNKLDTPSKDKDLTAADRTVIRGLLIDVRTYADKFLSERPHTTEFFSSPAFLALIERNGAGFSDLEQIGLVCEALKRAVAPSNAGKLYAALVGNVLLQTKMSPQGDITVDLLLPANSSLKAPLEETRHALIEWLRLRWKDARLQGGFAGVERWVAAEIASETDVRFEELFDPNPAPLPSVARVSKIEPTQKAPAKTIAARTVNSNTARSTRTNGTYSSAPFPVSYISSSNASQKANGKKVSSATKSIKSVAASTRSTATSTPSKVEDGPSQTLEAVRDSLIDSEVSETASFVSAMSVQTARTARPSRPSSPAAPSVVITDVPEKSEDSSGGPSAISLLEDHPATVPSSPAASIRSLKPSLSESSTPLKKTLVRKITPSNASINSLNRARPFTTSLTPSSRTSAHTTTSTAQQTASLAAVVANRTSALRSATNSVASVASASSVRTAKTNTTGVNPTTPRANRLSTVSKSSVTPTKVSKLSVPSSAPPRAKSIKKSPSLSSVRTTASVRSSASASPSVMSSTQKKTVLRKVIPVPPLPELPRKVPEPPPEELAPVEPESPSLSSESVEAVNLTDPTNEIVRKGSAETLRTTFEHENTPTKRTILASGLQSDYGDRSYVYPIVRGDPAGSTLAIGIPCIVTARRKRFRALARYIGEVLGEAGPWVGIEVYASSTDDSMNISWADRGDGDGTWHGVRYFDIGDTQKMPMKRVGDQLALRDVKRVRSVSPSMSEAGTAVEPRGLFVRPGQILYVVEAVDDL